MHRVSDKQLCTEFDQRAVKGTLNLRGLALQRNFQQLNAPLSYIHTTEFQRLEGSTLDGFLLSSCCRAVAADRREKGAPA